MRVQSAPLTKKSNHAISRLLNQDIVGWVDDPDTYPVSAKRHTFEYLREVAHLRPRTNTFGAIARVRHCLAMAVHRFFHERGFYWVHTPIITASDAEGAGEMFRVTTLPLDGTAEKNEDGSIKFKLDMFNVVLGIIAQCGLTILPMYLVLWMKLPLLVTIAILAVIVIILKKTWWNKLDEEVLLTDQSKENKKRAHEYII